MNASRNYDNTLFSLLVATFIGWIALSAVSGPIALSPAVSSAVVEAAVTASGNS